MRTLLNKVAIERKLYMEKITGYVGTYASENSHGIYHFSFDKEVCEFDKMTLFFMVKDAKYVSLHEHTLAVPCMEESAGICILDERFQHSPSKLFMEDTTACYVVEKDNMLYTANYHEGTVMIYKKVDHKLQFHHKLEIAPKAGCHQVIIYKNYLVVSCLLLDKIAIYDLRENYKHVKDILFDKKVGPRHGVFNNDQSFFYVVSELSNEVFFYTVEDLTFTCIKRVALPTQGHTQASSAAIRLSKNEQYVYVSIRGENIICVLDVKSMRVIQTIDSGGDHPRDIAIYNDYLFVVNRFSNNLVVFPIDKELGTVKEKIAETQVFEGVSIVFHEGGQYV